MFLLAAAGDRPQPLASLSKALQFGDVAEHPKRRPSVHYSSPKVNNILRNPRITASE